MIKRKSILLQQIVITDYRMGIFLLLRDHWGNAFNIIAGDYDFSPSTRSTPLAWEHFINVPNYFFLKRKLVWQGKVVGRMLGADVLIINANVRNLSNAVVVILRKLLGRKTIYWGHASGKLRADSWMRKVFLYFADGFIAYTETQKDVLQNAYPGLKVWAAANSCVYAADCRPLSVSPELVQNVIYVGRLVKKKKVALLLEGFADAVKRDLLPKQTKLVFVGAGEERANLEELANKHGIASRVVFTGHISDVERLREYYSESICAVSPGYVGLSATQAFSFGVPMLIARDEPHSPEIEACVEGFNSQFFTSDNAHDLADKLAECLGNRKHWFEQRQSLSEWTKTHYSFEAMRNAFVRAVEEIDPEITARESGPAS